MLSSIFTALWCLTGKIMRWGIRGNWNVVVSISRSQRRFVLSAFCALKGKGFMLIDTITWNSFMSGFSVPDGEYIFDVCVPCSVTKDHVCRPAVNSNTSCMHCLPIPSSFSQYVCAQSISASLSYAGGKERSICSALCVNIYCFLHTCSKCTSAYCILAAG